MSGDSMLADLRTRTPGGASVLFAKDAVSLHAMVTSAGYDRCTDAAYDWHGLRRGQSPFVLVQHTLSGGGRLRFRGAGMPVGPGQTMLLRFPDDNRYWLPRHGSWEFFWLCLNGREVLRIWDELMALHGPLVRLAPATVERLAALCAAVLDGAAASAPRASAIAYEAAMALLDDLWPRRSATPAVPAAPAVARVQAICRARLADPALDVSALAHRAGYSRHHFTRMFADSVGMPPGRYLMRLRMEEAVRLLVDGRASVKQVAARCGFADANYFTKAFRRSFGLTPNDVRRSGAFRERDG